MEYAPGPYEKKGVRNMEYAPGPYEKKNDLVLDANGKIIADILTQTEDRRAHEIHATGLLFSAAPEMHEAICSINKFLDSLPKGWLGKTSGGIGALNDFFVKQRQIEAKLNGN